MVVLPMFTQYDIVHVSKSKRTTHYFFGNFHGREKAGIEKLVRKKFNNSKQTHTNTSNIPSICRHVPRRIQCLPGNIGRLESISARIQPTDQMSTSGECNIR